MEKHELNRDIKRLAKVTHIDKDGNPLKGVRDEWYRLYLADRKLEYMNALSIRYMLRMNLKYRFVPLHTFGIFIDLPGE